VTATGESPKITGMDREPGAVEGSADARYRIRARLAAGGMGEVYRAVRVTADGFEKPVALKVIRRDLAADQAFARRFLDEARVAMSLSHGNVVQSFDVGRLDDRWFIAMELVDGLDLATLLAGRTAPLPWSVVLLVALEALKGLDHAHRQRGADGGRLGLVHRDVSPGNLLLSREGEVKLADFGIAVATLEARDGPRLVEGKLPYMAPEQLTGGSVDARSDLYGLGAVLREVLTGHPPVAFGADPRDALRVLRSSPRPPPPPDVPEGLWGVAERALSFDPDDRFPSAAAMRQALEAQAIALRCLPSSIELAEVVAEALAAPRRAGFADGSGATGDAVTAAGAGSGGPRTPTTDEEAAPSGPLGTGRIPGDDDAFDAMLGRELAPVPTGGHQGVHTWTVAGGVPPPLDAPDGAGPSSGSFPPPPVPAAGAADGRVSTAPAGSGRGRRRWAGRGVVGLGALALALGAAIAALSWAPGAATRDPPTSSTATRVGATPPAVPPPGAAPAGNVATAAAAAPTASDPGTAVEAPAAVGAPAPPGADQDPPADAAEPRRRSGRKGGPRRPSPAREPAAAAPPLPEPAPPARLSANTDPWSYLAVDGVRIGQTPVLGAELTPGRHRLTFRNPVHRVERTVVIDVRPGEHERVTLDLHAAATSSP